METRLPKLSPLTRDTLTRWMDEQYAQGMSRWTVWYALLKADRSRLTVDEAALLSQVESELSAVWLERNLEAMQCEKVGQIDKAIRLYEANLRDEFDGGRPYERLRIIYTKRKDYENALRACEAYLKLPPSEYLAAHRAEFAEHRRKLMEKMGTLPTPAQPAIEKTRKVRAPSTERADEEHGIPVRWLEGEKLVKAGGGKAAYLSRSQAGLELTIEQFVLEEYGKVGYRGQWTENQYWWAVMALLFWDVIFAKLPGVYTPRLGDFPSRHQDMPLDLFTEQFYQRREQQINQRCDALTKARAFGLSRPSIEAELRSSFHKHHGQPCRMLDWQKFSQADDMLIGLRALSSEQLITIMRRLLENFNTNRRGIPDLFLVRDAIPLFVEVKSEREQIAEHQVSWLKFLAVEVKVPVEICRVVAGA